mmetsp:Transcript_6119/g.9752  ORF Transcript_6119/g.9752 Transcript_6119/m.9752 type:complete len:97 (-) Transcript_6119:149-439(-)
MMLHLDDATGTVRGQASLNHHTMYSLWVEAHHALGLSTTTGCLHKGHSNFGCSESPLCSPIEIQLSHACFEIQWKHSKTVTGSSGLKASREIGQLS